MALRFKDFQTHCSVNECFWRSLILETTLCFKIKLKSTFMISSDRCAKQSEFISREHMVSIELNKNVKMATPIGHLARSANVQKTITNHYNHRFLTSIATTFYGRHPQMFVCLNDIRAIKNNGISFKARQHNQV
ncbi:hypothetical protein M3Y95_00458600 [Aphelenchoides besseyi]|nr:hypothetical protein M3Y95_00458600 [Aphelenchoides besseyi]